VDASHRLVLVWQDHLENRTRPLPPPSSVVLLSDVFRVEIGYRGASGSAWQAQWSGSRLPRLIRLRVVFSAASHLHMPDIVLAPMRDRWRL
jgi:hypothetical protein